MKDVSSGVVVYLLCYNITCCAGWLMVLLLSLIHFYKSGFGNINVLWDEIEYPLKLVQTVALLEVVHIMIGFVKSPVGTTFIQVMSRLVVLWLCMDMSVVTNTSMFMVLTVISWSLVEVPRYLFYALHLLHAVPYSIFWLRYSLFAILYPTGISGELGCMYLTYMAIQNSSPMSWMPLPAYPSLQLNMSHMLVFIALTYIPGAPKMYMHMLKTRRKQFSTQDNHDKKK